MEEKNQTAGGVPGKLREIAETGVCVWYAANGDDLARAFLEGAIQHKIQSEAGTAAAGGWHKSWEALEEDERQMMRLGALAVVDHLSTQTSLVFLELEIYAIALYQCLYSVRTLLGPQGVLSNDAAGLEVDVAAVLDETTKPRMFVMLADRLLRALATAETVERLREEVWGVKDAGGGSVAVVTTPFTQENQGTVEKARELGEGERELFRLLGELKKIVVTLGAVRERTPQPVLFVEVESDMIAAYAYAPRAMRLYIKWKKPGKGAPFGVYERVPQDIFEQFERADSFGQFIHQRLRNNPERPYKPLDSVEGLTD